MMNSTVSHVPFPNCFKSFKGTTAQHYGHRKRTASNFSNANLEALNQALYRCLLDRTKWKKFKVNVNALASAITKYVDGFEEHNKRMKNVHRSPSPIREVSSSFSYCLIPGYKGVHLHLSKVDEIVITSSPFEPNDHSPADARHRYNFLQSLKGGLSVPVVHLTYKAGNNIGDLHYIWRGDIKDTEIAS